MHELPDLHGALGWLSGSDSLARECEARSVRRPSYPQHDVASTLPPLCSYLPLLGEAECSEAVRFVCLEGVATRQPTACFLCCEIGAGECQLLQWKMGAVPLLPVRAAA